MKRTLCLSAAAAILLGLALLVWLWSTGPSTAVIRNESPYMLVGVWLSCEETAEHPEWREMLSDVQPGEEVSIRVPGHVSDNNLSLSFDARGTAHEEVVDSFMFFDSGRTRTVFRVEESLAVTSEVSIVGWRW